MSVSPAIRRYAVAKAAIEGGLIAPLQEILDATHDAIVEARVAADDAKAYAEQMRPHWAKGFTDDSMAAQAQTNALSELWVMLGVENQTAAVERLQALIRQDDILSEGSK